MSVRKKSPPTLSQPFEFANLEKLVLERPLMKLERTNSTAESIKWSVPTHVQVHDLGYLAGPQRTLRSDGVRGPGEQVLWDKGKYGQSLVQNRVYPENDIRLFDEFIARRPYTHIHLPASSTPGTSSDIVRRMLLGEGESVVRLTSKIVKTGEFAQVDYLVSKYFLAYLPKIGANLANQSFINNLFTGLEKGYSIVPLVTMVIKKPDVPLVRAHWLCNEPIEADLFELWVDKSLDDEDSKHPFRTQYVRSIRNPLIKTGIKVVIKDNLRAECYTSATVPKFKTLKEEKKWVDTKVEKVLSAERRKYGVSTPEPAFPF